MLIVKIVLVSLLCALLIVTALSSVHVSSSSKLAAGAALGECEIPSVPNGDISVKLHRDIHTVEIHLICHPGYQALATVDWNLCDTQTGQWKNRWNWKHKDQTDAEGLPLCSLSSFAPPVVQLSFDGFKPLRNDLTLEYVSVNIDSSSIAKGFDFTDPVLNNLVAQLYPVLLRLGGTASNGLVWTGQPGMPCGCCHHAGVAVSTDCFDSIYSFLNYTGARLLFDFSATRGNNGAWNTSDADGLMSYAAKHQYGDRMGAWQMGNENPGITNGTQMGRDFLTLQQLARHYSLPDTIIGPSAGGTPLEWFEGFWNVTYGALDMFSVHSYGGVNCNDLTGNSFVSRRTYLSFVDGLHGLVENKNKYLAPNTGLLIEETASAPIGGCVNMSDRFIDGFYWMTVIGLPAEHGVTQINRQDVAGWSFLGLESHYALAGPPGWTNGSALLKPHADWYSTVLWKQLMGTSVLNFSVTGDVQATSNITLRAWCSSRLIQAGSITISFVVGWMNAVTLMIPSLTSLTPRIEYMLTSTAEEYESPIHHHTHTQAADALPASLFEDVIFLNGQRMSVDDLGRLPEYPVQGRRINASTAPPPLLPLYSYGFIVFPEAGVAACT